MMGKFLNQNFSTRGSTTLHPFWGDKSCKIHNIMASVLNFPVV